MHWCARCDNCRWVCENHPEKPWLGDHACTCGGAGMPCPRCNPSDEENPPDMPAGFKPDPVEGALELIDVPPIDVPPYDPDSRSWSDPEPATSFRTIDGKPMHWRDERGVVHACEGADIHPDVRAYWTLRSSR